MKVIEILKKKIALVKIKKELKSQISSNPRDSIKNALILKLVNVNAEILKLDSSFVEEYEIFKKQLKLNKNGEIDVDALTDRQRDVLKEMQELLIEACVDIEKQGK